VSERFIVWLTTNRVATWWFRNLASRLDPLLFRATNGRLTSFGPPAMPMLTLTTTGRRSGRLPSRVTWVGMVRLLAAHGAPAGELRAALVEFDRRPAPKWRRRASKTTTYANQSPPPRRTRP
jgi:hypothetical protein